MLVEKVENYLTSKDRLIDKDLVESMKGAFDWAVTRQVMEVRESKPGLRGSNPGPCARKMAYNYLDYGSNKDPEARTYITWLTGDLLELVCIGLLRLAGIKVRGTCLDDEGQVEGMFDAGNGILVPCHPDGILLPQDGVGEEEILLEVKSTSDFGFKREWSRGFYSDNYKLQHQVYLDTFSMSKGVFFVINKNTGHFCEVLTERDPDYLAWAKINYEIAANAEPDNLPPRFVDNKNYGRKVNKKQELQEELAWGCGYCDFVGHCWPGLTIEFEKGKPVHKVPLDTIDNASEVRFPEVIGITGSDTEDLFEF